jgi:hypothetical protein
MYHLLGEDLLRSILSFLPHGFFEMNFCLEISRQARVPVNFVLLTLGREYTKILTNPFFRYKAQRLCVGDVECKPSLYIPRSRVEGRIITSDSIPFPFRSLPPQERVFSCSYPFQKLTHIHVDNQANLDFWLTIDLTKIRFPEDHRIHRPGAKWVATGRVATFSDLGGTIRMRQPDIDMIDRFTPWVGAYFTDSSFMSIRCDSLACPSFWLRLDLH